MDYGLLTELDTADCVGGSSFSVTLITCMPYEFWFKNTFLFQYKCHFFSCYWVWGLHLIGLCKMAALSVEIIFATMHASWPLYFVTQKVIEIVYLFIFPPPFFFYCFCYFVKVIQTSKLITSLRTVQLGGFDSVFHDIEVTQSFCLSNLLPELFM